MIVRRILKKALRVPILHHLGICIVSLSVYPLLPPQLSPGQETNTIAETSVNLQHGNTATENRDKPDTSDSHLPAVAKQVGAFARQRRFGKTISHIPVFDKNGTIYLASCDGKVSAIDPDGNTKWYIQLADKINTGLAISSDNILYFSSERMLYAIGSNGILKWVFNADNTIDFPSVLDNQGNIYLVTKEDDYLYVVRADGNLYWKAHINGHISTPPSITVDGSIYITTKDNMLYALNTDGSLRWRRKIYCRQTDAPATAAKTSNDSNSNTALQYGTKHVRESPEQAPPQTPRISNIKPEEMQTSSAETDTPTSTSFSASVLDDNSPFTIKFSDTSTGKITGRCWDFGDGTLANAEQYTVHTYAKPGTYDVRLIIGRPDSTSAIIRKGYITITETCSGDSREIMTNAVQPGSDSIIPLNPPLAKGD